MKECNRCKEFKLKDDFFKNKSTRDGLYTLCKSCVKKRREQYFKTENGKAKRKIYIAKANEEAKRGGNIGQKKWAKKNQDKTSANEKRWTLKNPEKRIAHHAVRNAIYHGLLIKRPCEQCGNPKSQGHHPDYSKPLEVIWLCAQCHALEHKLEREKARQEA